jgi:alpha-L-rhamnosidase
VLKRAGIYTAVGHNASGSSTRFESFKPYGLRYLQVNVTGHNAPLKIKRIGVISQLFPFELIGDFRSSDPIFNNLWTLGWRTLRVCSEDTYTDTPFRERGLYAGDALPQYAITLAGSGDSRLIKRSLEVFQDHYREVFFPAQKNRKVHKAIWAIFHS